MKSVNCVTSVYFLYILFIKEISAYSPLCTELMKTPNFDLENVVDTWKVCYLWRVNNSLENANTTISGTLTKATQKKIDAIAFNMRNHTKDHIEWSEAALIWKVIGSEDLELVFIPDKERPVGSFKCVPNMPSKEMVPDYLVPTKHSALKFIPNKYLVVVNCDEGHGFLMTRVNHTVSEKEIEATAKTVFKEDGQSTKKCSN